MPRISRFVMPGAAHHVTQRGNRRGRVFFSDADHLAYLSWLREYSSKYGLEVLAYCLMTNHVHLVAIPAAKNSLHRTLRSLHVRYAQRVNRAHEWKGHLWQGRFFASVLDEPFAWAAIRYVELNPVRAGMVERAQDYEWSSARAHCGLSQDAVLSTGTQWQRRIAAVGDWSSWLQQGLGRDQVEALRRNGPQGLPCGSAMFIEKLEFISRRCLHRRPKGPPKKNGVE